MILSSWVPSTVVWLCSRATGKAKPLYTPLKYKKKRDLKIKKGILGELEVGDEVYNENGKLVKVTQIKPVIFEELYEIALEDGSIEECGPYHEWCVKEDGVECVRETQYIYNNFKQILFELPKFPKKDGYYKKIVGIRNTGKKVAMRCISVDNPTGLFLSGDYDNITHNSFMASVFLMLRSLLFANNNCYIMAPSGNQSQETFTKMEDIAKKNIASLTGTTDVFFNECMRMNSIADPFTHSKQGFTVSLYNGSTVNSLNSVAKNIVGIRSNTSFFDEAGKIDRDYYALTLPFTVQSADFITGTGINSEIYPKQLPNKNVFLSSAEGIDSYLFEMYKLCYNKMLLGDPDYFVCDIDCNFSLHPLMNGKPYMAQLKQSQIDDAMKTNPYRATREYYNIFDSDGGEDVFVKRSVILKNSYSYFPEYFNDGVKKYIIAYDPSSKLDNSIVGIAELFRDEEKGLMLKMVNCENLIELLPNGEKAIIQKPQQIELIKKMLLDYNRGALDYENIDLFIIDAGAGGGGFDIAAFLMNEWLDDKGKSHLGMIDENDPYMKLRLDDYPANAKNLRLFNFKRDKVQAYERAQQAVNQGLVMFPKSLNAKDEMEIEETDTDGNLTMRYEKVSFDEKVSLVQLDLMKEELIATQKYKKPNGTIQFDLSHEAKQKNMFDDRADVFCMICDRLMELRAQEALTLEEKPVTDFKDALGRFRGNKKVSENPFNNRSKANPFARYGRMK
jgi:hypothetical protein